MQERAASLLVHANGVLHAVYDATTGASVLVRVLGTAGLVSQRLAGGFGLVGLELAADR